MNAQVIDFQSYRAKKQSLEMFNPFATLMAYSILALAICEIWQRGLIIR